MFQGNSVINMDAKGRIAIPTKCREQLAAVCGGQIVVTVNSQAKCLCIYPQNEWDAEIRPAVQALPAVNKHAARMKRLVIGFANEFSLDANGRVLLPQTLREYAGLEKELMIVGQGNKFELWDKQAWDENLSEDIADEPMPEAMMSLNI